MSDPDAVPGTAPTNPTSGTDRGTVRYSVPQAARALGISERAVRKRVEAGTLPAVREGKAWVVFLERGTDAVADAVPDAVPDTAHAVAAVPERGTDAVPPAPAVDERDIRIATLEAEREGLSHLLAFTKDELQIVREEHALERERDRETYARELEAVRADHAAAVANYQRTIDDLTAAVGGQADTIRALQARVVLPQLVAGDHTGNALESPPDALQRTDPPFTTHKTLKGGSKLAAALAALAALKFWEKDR